MQSDETLITQIFFFLTMKQMEIFLLRLGNKLTNRTNNEAKLKH